MDKERTSRHHEPSPQTNTLSGPERRVRSVFGDEAIDEWCVDATWEDGVAADAVGEEVLRDGVGHGEHRAFAGGVGEAVGDGRARALKLISPLRHFRRRVVDIPVFGSIPAGLGEDRE